MDTLTGIKVFRQVVESGSFVAAGERLDISTAMVSKHVMHIEKRIGVRLLNRNNRTLSLTEPGLVYFERCKTILDDLEQTELELGSLNAARYAQDHRPELVCRTTDGGIARGVPSPLSGNRRRYVL